MYVTELIVDGYKNLSDVCIRPDPHCNLIVGKNAQGKTNLLESIWLMTGCKSFRGTKERDYIGFDKQRMQLKLKFQDARREQEIQYAMQRGGLRDKKLLLNGVAQKSPSRLFERFQCVVFTPDDRELIKGTPDRRRSFVDLCYSQIRPKSLEYIRKYDALISQRNAVIKSILARQGSTSQLQIWDEQLAVVGSYLSFRRNEYIQKLNACCADLYARITAGKEQFSIQYASNIFTDYTYPERPDRAMAQHYYQCLQAGIADDLRIGYTSRGAGRDDLLIQIDGLSVREYGSQGQQKSAALVLRLAQADIFYADLSESPVILLDDVMGELDTERQKLVFEIVKNMQVFITTCNADAVISNARGSMLWMENGIVVNE